MKKLILLPLILLLAACAMPLTEMADTGMAEPEMGMGEAVSMTEGELTVANVLANLALPTDTGSVWLLIMNGTDTDDALLGAEIPGCGVVELHDMKMDGDVMVMRPVEGQQIPIPAGETVELKRGGLHIMCIQKAAPLEVGTTVDMVLQFANAGTINVTGEVVAPGDSSMQPAHGDMDMGGGGMARRRHDRHHGDKTLSDEMESDERRC